MGIVRVIGDFHLSDTTPRSWQINYFDNCLYELREATKGIKNLIVLGDFFDKPTLPDAYKLRLIQELTQIKESGCTIWSIVGNHDIIGYNMSESSFEKTSINLINSASSIGGGYFNLIPNEGVEIDGIRFVPYNGCRGELPEKSSSITDVLLGHAFFNNPIDEILNLTKEDIANLGYFHVLLGHDHEPHNDAYVGEIRIIRPGAFTRTSSHQYNLIRKPTVVDLSIASGNVVAETVELDSVLPSNLIFKEDCFSKKSKPSNKTFEANLSQMFDLISESTANRSDLSLSKVLEEVGTPERSIDYIRSIHRIKGINWT